MSTTLDTVVLAAFDDIDDIPSEVAPWRDRVDVVRRCTVDGIPSPILLTDDRVGIIETGMGKSAAATTVSTLMMTDTLVVDDALVLTVGCAGGPPTLDLGSVVIADAIVDWDHKCRVDSGDGEHPIFLNSYTGGVKFELDKSLVNWAYKLGRTVDLSAPSEVKSGDSSGPSVVRGTTLCGDEFWHGSQLADQAGWLVQQHEVSPYRSTEMEDAGTALALDRFDTLDRYLSIRGISNHDRPLDEITGRNSVRHSNFESGFSIGIENAVRVANRILEEYLDL